MKKSKPDDLAPEHVARLAFVKALDGMPAKTQVYMCFMALAQVLARTDPRDVGPEVQELTQMLDTLSESLGETEH